MDYHRTMYVLLYKIQEGLCGFTTFDGIVRYDGYSFKTYRRYDNGLDTGLMLYVTEDAAGNLWVGTEMGLYCYDIDTDQFTRISSYFPKDFGIQKSYSQNQSCRRRPDLGVHR